eukprot:3592566-Heterocapsa_arctica.AAC.1
MCQTLVISRVTLYRRPLVEPQKAQPHAPMLVKRAPLETERSSLRISMSIIIILLLLLLLMMMPYNASS